MMNVLFEQWTACSGKWTRSSFLVSLRDSRSHKKRGCRRWLTYTQLCEKYNPQIAEEICLSKLNDVLARKTDVKPHPDLPDNPSMTLFRVFDSEGEIDESDTVVESLFQLEDKDDFCEPAAVGGKKSGGKKKKNRKEGSTDGSSSSSSTASSMESDSDGDDSSSTSSSSHHKKKRGKKSKKNKKGKGKKNKKSKKEKRSKKGKKNKKDKKETAEQLEKRLAREKKRAQEKAAKEKEKAEEKKRKAEEKTKEDAKKQKKSDAMKAPQIDLVLCWLLLLFLAFLPMTVYM